MPNILRPAVLSIVPLLLLASAALAQTSGDPYASQIRTIPTPYWGYVRSPYASALHGQADLTRAIGTYHVRIQQASKMREETRQLKLQTRKEELKYIRWRQNYLWDMRQEEVQRIIKHEEKRAIERPALTEILVGSALNNIYDQLKRNSQSGGRASEPLKQEWLDNVNLVSTNGHVGMLRQKQLIWPAVLQEERFNTGRVRIEALLEQARQDVKKGKLSVQTIKSLLTQHKQMDEDATTEVTSKNSTWGPTHHILANRFLTELKQTILLLQNPKEAQFLFGHVPSCKTVSELVQHMRENGLRFGPASAGSERQYVSLHDTLAKEARAVGR